jgi:hypothetical protein
MDMVFCLIKTQHFKILTFGRWLCFLTAVKIGGNRLSWVPYIKYLLRYFSFHRGVVKAFAIMGG